MLALVLNIHDGTGGEVYKLGQMLLRPAFGLASAPYFFAQGATIQAFFILVHSHIPPHIILHFMSEYENEVQFYILVVFYFIFISLNL